ncbi:S-layer homology domain-containing protein [bacterium]|nr:S-layer homology domain-containing protein [bacterium]
MKRFSIFLVVAFVFSTMAASANPFSDVPFSHWAYDAVNKLASKGLLQGYPDGTFKGEKHVTRYALAMVTAKLYANIEQMMEKGLGDNLVTKADLQTLEKLTVEFADELALLGVKVTALEDDMQVVKEDVSVLKKDVEGIKDYMAKGGMEKVKLSGDMLVRHSSLIHNRDWAFDARGPATLGGVGGNTNNSQTQTELRFQFKASIDENVTAVARWHMLGKVDSMLAVGNNATAWGNNGLRNGVRYNADTSMKIDLAYLHIKDMFRFGGDFTLGRNFYSTGHALLLSDYVDAIHYYKRSGDIDIGFLSIYDRHRGNYKDTTGVAGAVVDFRNVWGLTFGGKYRDNDLYLNFLGQDEPNLYNRTWITPAVSGASRFLTTPLLPGAGAVLVAPTAAGVLTPNFDIAMGNTVAGQQRRDNWWAVEFGGKGPLGRNGHWDYDLGFVYTNYELSIFNTGTTFISPSMQGWVGHAAVKWDSKKEWAAKLGYTFGTDENTSGLSLDNDRRYDNGIETPYEDISKGNNYFMRGLMNMWDLKLQVEYRPRDTKHYFRLAGDFLDEVDDTTTNDLARLGVGHNTSAGVPSAFVKTNTLYDRWNNFVTADPQAFVLTFEYRYQLAENTRIRVGYTAFDMTGNETKAVGAVTSARAGRGVVGDYDYNLFWAEVYSQF